MEHLGKHYVVTWGDTASTREFSYAADAHHGAIAIPPDFCM